MNFLNRINGYFNRIKYLYCLYQARNNDKKGDTNGKGSAIVMFHHVSNDNSIKVSDSCKCSVAEFIAFLDFVQTNKHVVTIDQMLDAAKNGDIENMVVISFDDVPSNFISNAYPILKERNLPFILFVATGFIGKEGFLSYEQVKILAHDSLVTIGAHSVNHPMLREQRINLYEEICGCKNLLESLINKPINYYAYPYGTPTAINKKVITFVERYGSYKNAFTTIPGLINCYSIHRLFALPRIQSKLYMDVYRFK